MTHAMETWLAGSDCRMLELFRTVKRLEKRVAALEQSGPLTVADVEIHTDEEGNIDHIEIAPTEEKE